MSENDTPDPEPSERELADYDDVIRAEKTAAGACIPGRENPGDSGLDLVSPVQTKIFPGEQELIGLGIRIGIPKGYEGQIRPRSSYCFKRKLTVPNSPGTIDAGYRDEVKVLLYNYGPEAQRIEQGDRIAQLVIAPVWTGTLSEQEVPRDIDRGGGFGSTGR